VHAASARPLPEAVGGTGRAWLTPAHWLARYWSAFASEPPPAEFAALLDNLNAGHGINLYLRI